MELHLGDEIIGLSSQRDNKYTSYAARSFKKLEKKKFATKLLLWTLKYNTVGPIKIFYDENNVHRYKKKETIKPWIETIGDHISIYKVLSIYTS